MNELKTKLYDNINEYKKEYGVLCFLYSLLLTKVLLFVYKWLKNIMQILYKMLEGFRFVKKRVRRKRRAFNRFITWARKSSVIKSSKIDA